MTFVSIHRPPGVVEVDVRGGICGCSPEVFQVPFHCNFVFVFFIFEIKSCTRDSSSSIKTFIIMDGKSDKDSLTPRSPKLVQLCQKKKKNCVN